MATEGTHKAIIMVSEAERIRAPLEYPEHEDLNPEDPLISEGTTTDYISGREVKDSPKERVRQRIIRALFHEYGLSTESMESDFPIPIEVGGKKRRKKVEIAIFDYGNSPFAQSISHFLNFKLPVE